MPDHYWRQLWRIALLLCCAVALYTWMHLAHWGWPISWPYGYIIVIGILAYSVYQLYKLTHDPNPTTPELYRVVYDDRQTVPLTKHEAQYVARHFKDSEIIKAYPSNRYVTVNDAKLVHIRAGYAKR